MKILLRIEDRVGEVFGGIFGSSNVPKSFSATGVRNITTSYTLDMAVHAPTTP
jgi:hypothetical protein